VGVALLHVIATVSEHWTKYRDHKDKTIFEFSRGRSDDADLLLSAQCLVGISCGIAILALALYILDLFCNVIKDRSARSSRAMTFFYLLAGLCEIAGIVCFAVYMGNRGAEIDDYGWSFFVSCVVALLCLILTGLFCKE